MSCVIKFQIVLDNSSVADLFALLIAVFCAIKPRNIVVLSSDAARGLASWHLNAVISARISSFCFVIFCISSYKAVRRSSVGTAGAAARACRASSYPRIVERSTVNCATFAESCWNCSDVYCIAAGANEAVGSDALCNLASSVVTAILTTFTDRVAVLQTLQITINGIFEFGARERVPHVGMCALCQLQTLCILGTQLHLLRSKSDHAKFLPLLAKLWALFGLPGPAFRAPRRRACARALAK